MLALPSLRDLHLPNRGGVRLFLQKRPVSFRVTICRHIRLLHTLPDVVANHHILSVWNAPAKPHEQNMIALSHPSVQSSHYFPFIELHSKTTTNPAKPKVSPYFCGVNMFLNARYCFNTWLNLCKSCGIVVYRKSMNYVRRV